MKIKFKPLGARIMVSDDYEEEKTATGIIFTQSEVGTPTVGVVVALGAEAADVEIGDKVHFIKYSGTTVIVEGKVYNVLQEEDVIGIYLV